MVGERVGVVLRTLPFVKVSWVCPVPSGFMRKISSLPSRTEENAILDPSRDQAGSPSRPFAVVRRRRSLPLAFIDQMSGVFENAVRMDENAIRVPSPDQVGRSSVPGFVVSWVFCDPSTFI